MTRDQVDYRKRVLDRAQAVLKRCVRFRHLSPPNSPIREFCKKKTVNHAGCHAESI
jgi:hypothetical protein